MIPAQIVSDWRIHAPWPDDDDVEQDLILTRMLLAIYSDPFLSEKLAFRGGTCLNKLFWPIPVRYSEDLDFVQINAEPAGKTIVALRKILDPLFEIKGKWDARQHSYRINYSFQSEIGGGKRRIKIEINTREHFTFEGHQKKILSMRSAWHSGKCEVVTFSLEELLATKLRALYQRNKGRDMFDLWRSRELKPDWIKVVSIFLKYLKSSKNPVHRDMLNENLKEKIMSARFLEDTGSLIMNQKEYDIREAAAFVTDKLYAQVPESKTKESRKSKMKNARDRTNPTR